MIVRIKRGKKLFNQVCDVARRNDLNIVKTSKTPEENILILWSDNYTNFLYFKSNVDILDGIIDCKY